MNVATSEVTVGVRELKNNLSRYIDQAQDTDIIVTEHGRPVARLSALSRNDSLAALIADGVVRAPTSTSRRRPSRRIKSKGTVSDLVADQRR